MHWWGSGQVGRRRRSFFFFPFLAALGLRCCVQASSSCGEWRQLSGCTARLLTVVASLLAERGLVGSSSCGPWAQLPHGMWDLPRPGIEPVASALAGRFLTTGPLGKSLSRYSFQSLSMWEGCLDFCCQNLGSVGIPVSSPLSGLKKYRKLGQLV